MTNSEPRLSFTNPEVMVRSPMSWDKFYLGMAEYVSRKSKDPSTQTGAVIVRPDMSVCSVGYNGFPRRISDTQSRLENREFKYMATVHCEMNAVISSHDTTLDGYTLYTFPFISCDRCAVHMIQCGITRFVCPRPSLDALKRWKEAFERSRNLILESGAELVEMPWNHGVKDQQVDPQDIQGKG